MRFEVYHNLEYVGKFKSITSAYAYITKNLSKQSTISNNDLSKFDIYDSKHNMILTMRFA